MEELVCLAHWKDGSTRYLVGQLQHKMATSDEDRYRCFVWERRSTKIRQGYDVAQSGDATCNGLLSPTEGSRTMRLTKGESLPLLDFHKLLQKSIESVTTDLWTVKIRD